MAVYAVHLLVNFIQNQSGNSMVKGLSAPTIVTSDTLSIRLSGLLPCRMTQATRQVLMMLIQRPTCPGMVEELGLTGSMAYLASFHSMA